MLTPSDRSRIQAAALSYFAERIGWSESDADLSIEGETLKIDTLLPEIIDDCNGLRAEICTIAHLSLGVSHIEVWFFDELLVKFQVNCETSNISASQTMVATLEKPVEVVPGQIELIADVKPEQLCTIDTLIDQISRRTGMTAESIQEALSSLQFNRFQLGDQILIPTRAIDMVLGLWASAIANEVRSALKSSPEASTTTEKAPAKTGVKRKAAPAKKSVAKPKAAQ